MVRRPALAPGTHLTRHDAHRLRIGSHPGVVVEAQRQERLEGVERPCGRQHVPLEQALRDVRAAPARERQEQRRGAVGGPGVHDDPGAEGGQAGLQAAPERGHDLRGGLEVHVGDGERQQVRYSEAVLDVVPLRAPGAATVHGDTEAVGVGRSGTGGKGGGHGQPTGIMVAMASFTDWT